MKKAIACGLVLVSLMGSISVAQAAGDVSFGDVPSDQWYYNSVMAMAEQGLLQGTGEVNGVPQFAPEATMTRAAYLTIAVRVAYPTELDAQNAENPTQTNWWDNAWNVAIEKGIINSNDSDMTCSPEDMNGTIRREEMALILVRTAHAKGVATEEWVLLNQIPDSKNVDPHYRDFVRECYTLGMLNGIDSAGTFDPQGTLDRASASQSFYKLLNADKRTPVTPEKPDYNQSAEDVYKPADTLQTWIEGEAHTIPQAGDTVITRDGRTVVLTMNRLGNVKVPDEYLEREKRCGLVDDEGYYALLGYGQGVDIATGIQINGYTVEINELGYGGSYFRNDKTPLKKSTLTNEVFTESQWSTIHFLTYPKGQVGAYDGEMGSTYWRWSTADSSWHWVGEH